MITLGTATRDLRLQLFNLLKICFEEDDKINNFFLDMVDYENYLLVKKDQMIISALYMMDASLAKENQTIPVYYIYAAGTLPEYRGMGAMSMLLNFANQVSQKRGRKYTILLPSDLKLYGYYQKCRYKKFFRMRDVHVKKDDAKRFFVSSNNTDEKLTVDKMCEIRKNVFSQNGNVVWNKKQISFARDFLNLLGHETVYSKNGYAICSKSDNCVFVNEIAALNYDYQDLLSNMFARYGECDYRFRVPVDSSLFENLGSTRDFGMIRPTSDYEKILDVQNPYLGLPLD